MPRSTFQVLAVALVSSARYSEAWLGAGGVKVVRRSRPSCLISKAERQIPFENQSSGPLQTSLHGSNLESGEGRSLSDEASLVAGAIAVTALASLALPHCAPGPHTLRQVNNVDNAWCF